MDSLWSVPLFVGDGFPSPSPLSPNIKSDANLPTQPTPPQNIASAPSPNTLPSSSIKRVQDSDFNHRNSDGSLAPFRLPQSSTPSQSFKFEVIPAAENFNRLQWYSVTFKFMDMEGNPTFIGRSIHLDATTAFHDARKRVPSKKTKAVSGDHLHISMLGVCKTSGKSLVKCDKCRVKDKQLRQAKRKKEAHKWSETDEENNNKILHTLSPKAGVKIDSKGEISFRVRVSCCVGVKKQHHMNHGESHGLQIHKGCPGIALSCGVKASPNAEAMFTLSKPIHVLGKVAKPKKVKSAAQKRKLEEEEEDPRGAKKAKVVVIQGNTMAPGAPIAVDADCAFHIVNVLKGGGYKQPLPFLYAVARGYLLLYDRIFPTPLREMFNAEFWTETNLRTIPSPSPWMCVICSVMGTMFTNAKSPLAHFFWDEALSGSQAIFKTGLSLEKGVLLLSDALNRTSGYFGSQGDLANARQYCNLGRQVVEMIIEESDTQVHPVLLSLTWTRCCYNLDFQQLETSYHWANSVGQSDTTIFVVFLLVVTLVCPDFSWPDSSPQPKRGPFQEAQKTQLLPLLDRLYESCKYAGYTRVDSGRHTYEALYSSSFSAFRNWISGDYLEAETKLSITVAQVSLLLNNMKFECFMPVFLAALCCIQMTMFNRHKYVEYAEIHLRSLLSISSYYWARPLTLRLFAMFNGCLEGPQQVANALSWVTASIPLPIPPL
eukprot:TRINITY_DN9031_c0_g1_i1.p1 TRINITY_DN9031_c0_g1~~TRINITY_DN9031_c0_g1_i1.p1  ORF type:complete len:713 (+),score=96.57 TRINITY_DN9031_c0_g1_i1:82-2220(+)